MFGQGVGHCLKHFYDTGSFGQRLCVTAVQCAGLQLNSSAIVFSEQAFMMSLQT